MKIKNKVLACALFAIVLSGCSTINTKTTVTKANGDVVVVEKVETSKNSSAIDTLRKTAIILATYHLGGGSVGLLTTVAQLSHDNKSLEFEKEKFYFEQTQRAVQGTENI